MVFCSSSESKKCLFFRMTCHRPWLWVACGRRRRWKRDNTFSCCSCMVMYSQKSFSENKWEKPKKSSDCLRKASSFFLSDVRMRHANFFLTLLAKRLVQLMRTACSDWGEDSAPTITRTTAYKPGLLEWNCAIEKKKLVVMMIVGCVLFSISYSAFLLHFFYFDSKQEGK